MNLMIPMVMVLLGALFIYSAIKGEKNPMKIVRDALSSNSPKPAATGKPDDWQM